MFGHLHSKKDFNYIMHVGIILSNPAIACLFLVANIMDEIHLHMLSYYIIKFCRNLVDEY